MDGRRDRSWLELYDSRVDEVRVEKKNLVLTFSRAYVHKSSGRPGIDTGSGWAQRIRLEFVKASLDGAAKGLPDKISDGEFETDSKRDGGIPIPFEFKGAVRLSLIFRSGNEIQVFGERMILSELGEPVFVEHFPGAQA